MHPRNLRLPMAGLATAAVSAAALIGASTAAAAPTVSIIHKGLNNPKYLTVGPNGNLYVAVSGDGGRQCVAGLGVQGSPTKFCGGDSGAIDQFTTGGAARQPVSTLLSSIREADNGEVAGPIAVVFHGKYAVELTRNQQSTATGTAAAAGVLGSSSLGYLREQVPVRVRVHKVVYRHGKRVRETVLETKKWLAAGANISGFAATHPQSPATLGGTPGETLYDSDPHDVVPYQGGYAVADAGANDLVLAYPRGGSKGTVSLIARFPTTPETAPAGVLGAGPVPVNAQAVPSSVTVGPDGALYVGVLGGIPGLPGDAVVYRVVPGQAPVPVVTGLTRVSDLAFNSAGQLLILENNVGGGLAPASTGGALLEATLNGTTPVTATNLDVPGLVNPTGLALDSSGNAYITNDTTGAGAGEILKVSGL